MYLILSFGQMLYRHIRIRATKMLHLASMNDGHISARARLN